MKLIECDSNLEYMCEGCSKANTRFHRCAIYATTPHMFTVVQRCPFNCTIKEKKVFKRVGQQKTKTKGGTIAKIPA